MKGERLSLLKSISDKMVILVLLSEYVIVNVGRLLFE